MKSFILSVLAITAILFSCTNSDSDKLQAFIPGTYVRTINNEFTTGMDTLRIEEVEKSVGSYMIFHASGYQQTIDGRTLPPQLKQEKWTAIYNDNTHQLMEQRKGKILTFFPDRGSMSMGGGEYRKIE